MPSRYPPVSPDMLHHPETLLGGEDRSLAQFTRTRYYDSDDSALNRTGDYRSSRRGYSTCCSKGRSVRGGIDLEPWLSRRSHSGPSLESHGHTRWSRRGVSTARTCTCKKPVQAPQDYIVFCPDPPFDRDAESEEDEEDDQEEQGAGHGVAYPDNSTATSPESFATPDDADDSIEPRAAGQRGQSGEPEDQWDEDSEATRHQAKVMSALEHIRWSREHRAEPAYRPHKDRTRRSPRDA